MSIVMRPTFRNLTDSFESWAYRHGLRRQLERLEERKWIERMDRRDGQRLYRLTALGRMKALGGRDPEACWARPWDGWWRMILFDVPNRHKKTREHLRRWLKKRHYGFLQKSVWVTPDPTDEETKLLAGSRIDPQSLLFLKSRPCAGESDAEVVTSAWSFSKINEAYREYMQFLKSRPEAKVHGVEEAQAMKQWGDWERELWREAIEQDPLLPQVLLPKNYLGRRAWAERLKALRQAGTLVSEFRMPHDPGSK